MALRRLTDSEAVRVGVVVSALLEVAAASGVAAISDVNAQEVTTILVATLPLMFAAGEWMRSQVYSKESARELRPGPLNGGPLDGS